MSDQSDLEKTEELYQLLQGQIPDGYKILEDHLPVLSPDQAWLVIWYLGNQYWQVTDHIERCGICGDLYDTESEGDCLDFGDVPYHFCQNCMDTDPVYRRKFRIGRKLEASKAKARKQKGGTYE